MKVLLSPKANTYFFLYFSRFYSALMVKTEMFICWQMLLNKSYYRAFIATMISLMFCCSSLSLSANENSNAINDSLYNIYLVSSNDSVHIAMLVQLAANMEANSTLFYKNNTVDDYLQLANLKSNDSVKINNLAFEIDKVGVKFRNNGYYISALKFHNWTRDIANRINNKTQQSIIYNNIGVVYRRLDDYQTAHTNHINALQLAEETGNIQSQVVAINSIGNVYTKKRDFAKALEYYFLSLDVNKEIKSEKGIAIEEKINLYFHDLINKNANAEFVVSIERVYDEYFKPALKTKMSGSIVNFSNSLEQLANKYNSKGIKNFCADLNSKITNFDIEEIDKLLNLFNTNYLQRNK